LLIDIEGSSVCDIAPACYIGSFPAFFDSKYKVCVFMPNLILRRSDPARKTGNGKGYQP